MNIGERIRQRRKELKLSQEALGKIVGVTKGAVSQWESNPKASLAGENLLGTARALKVSPDWLLTGRGSPDTASGSGMQNIEPIETPSSAVPLISWVQAGHWTEAVDPYSPGDAVEYLPCPTSHGPHTFALTVRGVSMEPKFQDGDVIYVDPSVEAINNSLVIVKLVDSGEVTFKQLVVDGEPPFEKRRLRALNTDWEPGFIPINGNAEIVGVVIGKWTRF